MSDITLQPLTDQTAGVVARLATLRRQIATWFWVDGLSRVGFTVYPPGGTYFIMADHSRFGFSDDIAFCKQLVEHAKVAAIPPSSFYTDPSKGRSLVRFAFCKTEDTLREGIRRMESLR